MPVLQPRVINTDLAPIDGIREIEKEGRFAAIVGLDPRPVEQNFNKPRPRQA